jgi:hypothetical protein
MFTQAAREGWGIKLRGRGFALRHVEEPTDEDEVEACVATAFAAGEDAHVDQSEALSAFLRKLPPRFVMVGVAIGSDVVHRK